LLAYFRIISPVDVKIGKNLIYRSSHELTLEQCLVADIVHIVYKHGCDQDFRIWSYTNY